MERGYDTASMARRSTRWVWTVMMTVPLTLTVVFSQSLEACGLSSLVCDNTRLVALAGDEVTLTCQTGEREESRAVDWFRNGERVDTTNEDRYARNGNQDRLDIRNIVGSDEGQYTCSYVSSSGATTHSSAECLVVYGRGYYETCDQQDRTTDCTSCTDKRTDVSSDGTIRFNLSIAFYGTGCSGHHQNIRRISVKKSNSLIYSCTPVCSDHVSRWWTVDNAKFTNITLTLHQALSSDRAEYEVETELDSPAKESINRICKTIHVTAPLCGLPPQVENATMSTLESTYIYGSQVNYSCNEGCTLQGSDSLRCGVQREARWPDPPTCSCQGTSVLDHLPAVTSIAITPTSALVMTPPTNQVSEDNGSTPLVAVSVSVFIIVLLVIVGAGAGAVAGCLIWHKRLTNQKSLSTTQVMMRTNGHCSPDGPHRESTVEEGVSLGSGDEESEFEEKNSTAVNI